MNLRALIEVAPHRKSIIIPTHLQRLVDLFLHTISSISIDYNGQLLIYTLRHWKLIAWIKRLAEDVVVVVVVKNSHHSVVRLGMNELWHRSGSSVPKPSTYQHWNNDELMQEGSNELVFLKGLDLLPVVCVDNADNVPRFLYQSMPYPKQISQISNLWKTL